MCKELLYTIHTLFILVADEPRMLVIHNKLFTSHHRMADTINAVNIYLLKGTHKAE